MAVASNPAATARVAHLSTAHARRDVRIHLKQCDSLAAAGYEVHCVMADGRGAETAGGVRVHDIGASSGRFQRMLLRPWRMLAAARALRARVYHLHDPELLLVALLLRRGGAKVVYDSHEDVPRALMTRDWIRPGLRRLLAGTFERFEDFVARRVDAVVGATPHIAGRFARLNRRTVDINNFPLEREIAREGARDEADAARGTAGEGAHGGAPAASSDAVAAAASPDSSRTVCYIGGIGRIRGIVEIVRALELVDARLILAGPWESADTERAARALPGWAKVDYRGVVGRDGVQRIMAASRAGLVFFHPAPNHVDAQPNKMFEYMSAGLPVLASNFALWSQVLEGSGAGRCADPLDPRDIARLIGEVLDDPYAARRMGERGRHAVATRYQWPHEERKLLGLYEELLR